MEFIIEVDLSRFTPSIGGCIMNFRFIDGTVASLLNCATGGDLCFDIIVRLIIFAYLQQNFNTNFYAISRK